MQTAEKEPKEAVFSAIFIIKLLFTKIKSKNMSNITTV